MNNSETNHFMERLQGLVKDLQFDQKHEKDIETAGYLNNAIRHAENALAVIKRIESIED